jgi:cytochrome c2
MASPWSPNEDEIEEEEYDRAGGEEGVVSVDSRALVPSPTSAVAPTPPVATAPTPPVTTTRLARAAATRLAAAETRRKRKKPSGAPCEADPANAESQPQVTPSPAGPALRSKCWGNFKRIEAAGDKIIAECLVCHKILRGESKNGTSHLLRHSKTMHPTDTNEVNNYFLKTERNDDGSCVLKNGKFDHESLRVAISLFLLGGSHAFTVVEEHGYKSMMTKACPQFKSISRRTIQRDIMNMFERDRKDLVEIIHTCASRVSFTTDNWKSEVTKFNYICITCHYIDASWKLNKRIIWFKKLNPPYDGATIADEVYLCFREWKLEDYKGLMITKFFSRNTSSSDRDAPSSSGGGDVH